MNRYKLDLMLKEFSFLAEILRKKLDTKHFTGKESREEAVNLFKKHYGEMYGFAIEEEDSEYLSCTSLTIPDEIKVKRGDENLLSTTPSFSSYSWSGGGHYDHCSFYSVGEDGRVTPLDESGVSRTGSGEHNEETAPSIGEQLFVKKLNPDFIVCYDFQDTDDNGNGEEKLSVTIYKMGKFNLHKYHCQKIDEAAAAIKAEIATICE